MNIVITGSTGFIGERLSEELSSMHSIVGISNNQKKIKKIKSINYDITSKKKFQEKIKMNSLIHLAAMSGFEKCEKNLFECFKTNIIGTLNMLEQARKCDANFIFSSSSHVYGKPKSLPINESAVLNSTSVYSSSKISAENLCKIYAEKYGMNITILRLFSVYGPNSPNENVISNIIRQLKNKSNVIIGNLRTKRDFIFIDNVIDAFATICNNQKKGFEIFNVCTNKSTSINEICQKLIKISKYETKVFSDKNKIRKNDIPEIKGNFSKLKKFYKLKPEINIDEGLQITFNK